MMSAIACSRNSHLTRRRSLEEVKPKPSQTLQQSDADSLGRSLTALSRHRPHQLAEIREASGSSRATLLQNSSSKLVNDTTNKIVLEQTVEGQDRVRPKMEKMASAEAVATDEELLRSKSPRSNLGSSVQRALSLPMNRIPKRTSSISILSQNYYKPDQGSVQDNVSAGRASGKSVSARGRTESPVRHAAEKGAQSSDTFCASSSRTFIRTTVPTEILDGSTNRHPRFEIVVRLQSPLFVGGGTIEGQAEVKVDMSSNRKARVQPLFISKLSIDVVGVEEVEDGRRRVFLSLATELFDRQHPPPATLVTSQSPEKGSELCWQTRPATSTVPFCVNLPLKLGPPPYLSRQASIRYLLCSSAVIKVAGKRHTIRQNWDVQMLTTHDPEKALASLPSPLVATETLNLSHIPVLQTIKLTAGLHRQTWVSGGLIFVDIHIVNSTDKIAKRVEIQLQKSVLWFSHSAAGTVEKSASNLRLPKKIDTEVVCKTTIKKNKEWNGVPAQSSETRTCELDAPKGHVTIGDGRYFEVRYFVKVTATLARSKTVSVQLPITIIHINSLDILPNSLAQVAASIEAKRLNAATTQRDRILHQPHAQGRAFTAARLQSLGQARSTAGSVVSVDIDALTRDVDCSPRRVVGLHDGASSKPLAVGEDHKSNRASCCQHLTQRPSCYHCHLMYVEHAAKTCSPKGPKLPRLQMSTSGLGFSESEFELPPDSPRKVMLSEQERKMINQQRELRMQRRWSQQKARSSGSVHGAGIAGTGFVAWKNVAATPVAGRLRTHSRSVSRQLPEKRSSRRSATENIPPPNLYEFPLPGRSRSKTNPEQAKLRPGEPSRARSGMRKPGHGTRSVDRGLRPLQASFSAADGHASVFGRPASIQSATAQCQKPP